MCITTERAREIAAKFSELTVARQAELAEAIECALNDIWEDALEAAGYKDD